MQYTTHQCTAFADFTPSVPQAAVGAPMEYNMSWFAAPGPAPYLLATDINDVMLSNVLDAPMLSDTPRSVSLMGAGGGGAGDQTAPPDLAATVPQEFAEWSYQVSRHSRPPTV